MKKIILFIVLVNVQFLNAQISYNQFFDGADTDPNNSIVIKFETGSPNIWQIGKPQKIIFDSASTYPNVIVTDTVNEIPDNNVSTFSFNIYNFIGVNNGILALRWKQKLDYEPGTEGGIIEYSVNNTGSNWKNVLNNPEVYNYYGFMPQNIDTLPSNDFAFSGTDSTWRDIWLCIYMNQFPQFDSIAFRFISKSDGINTHREGWMIDNVMSYITLMHPVKEVSQTEYISVYPNVTNGVLNIDLKKDVSTKEYDIIESMELINIEGKVIERYGHSARKTMIDISKYSPGMYHLKINTNVKSMTFPIILEKP